MIAQIAEDIRDKLAQIIQDARYLSVLVDGDTDISDTECEIVCVRFLEDGKPTTRQYAHAEGKYHIFIIVFFPEVVEAVDNTKTCILQVAKLY